MKIQEEALMGGAESWAMQIEFQGQLGHHRKVAVVDWPTFLDLREKASHYEAMEEARRNAMQCKYCGGFH